jgi:hypothetical protein
VASDVAERVLSEIFCRLMNADDSLQQLMGKLCRSAGERKRPTREVLASFRELLERNGVASTEVDAVTRSLQAHIGERDKETVDIAEFLSAWKCAAGVQADVDLTAEQVALAGRLSRLLGLSSGGSAQAQKKLRRRFTFSGVAPASAGTLMDFFTAADMDGDGKLSLNEGTTALSALFEEQGQRVGIMNVPGPDQLRQLLLAADVTGQGSLNYLEFLRLFDRQDPHCLTHQSLLDVLCFFVWVHRNALSGLFRYIGANGRVSREQIAWALGTLNRIAEGRLADSSIASLVDAVTFNDEGTVSAEEFLHAFDICETSDRRCYSP